MNSSQPDYTPTPDRRYYVVRGRLWRLSNPALDQAIHARLVRELMAAKRAVREGKDSVQRIDARLRVDAAKRGLGERGAVWWADGSPDYHRRLASDTPYAAWFAGCANPANPDDAPPAVTFSPLVERASAIGPPD